MITADPSAIGLFGLAIVTLVASSQKIGWTEGLGLDHSMGDFPWWYRTILRIYFRFKTQ